MTTMLENALKYAQAGYPVLPLNNKEPLIRRGSHGASSDEETVRKWWKRWPEAQIGIATGKISGLVVLDVDLGKEGVESSWNSLIQKQVIQLDTVRARSGAGGLHLYFKYPENETVQNTVEHGGNKGIDFRGDGGYIVAPPSIHSVTGKEYLWENSIFETTLHECPEFMYSVNATATLSYISAAPIPEGHRNVAMTAIAGILRTFGLNEEHILNVLIQQNSERCVPPLPETELESIAKHIIKYPPHNTRRGASDSLGDTVLLSYEPSEVGFAQMFTDINSGQLKYHSNRGKWYWWSSHYWRADHTGVTLYRSMEAARTYMQAALRVQDPEARAIRMRQGLKQQHYNFLNHSLLLATSFPNINAPADNWDKEEYLIACENGVLNLTDGTLRPGYPEDMISKHLEVIYNPNAYAPKWQKFLEEIFEGDQRVIEYVQRCVGYSLTGSVKEQCLFILLGFGANGKSTFLEVLHKLFGEYGQSAPFSTFERQVGGTRQSNDLAVLNGMRFISASEPRQGSVFDEGRLKQLTGGDYVTARFLHQEYFTFRPEGKIWIAANHAPIVKDDSDGFWRRVHKIDFNVKFWDADHPDKPAGAKVKNGKLRDELLAELPGILAWAVRGAIQWASEGLKPPTTVREATKAYEIDSDPLAPFIGRKCNIEPELRVLKEDLFRAYSIDCEAQKLKPYEVLTARRFHERLAPRYTVVVENGQSYYQGLALKHTESAPTISIVSSEGRKKIRVE
jgi:putative DNA primase/helicase